MITFNAGYFKEVRQITIEIDKLSNEYDAKVKPLMDRLKEIERINCGVSVDDKIKPDEL